MEFLLILKLGNEGMERGGDVSDALGKVMHAVAGLELAEGQGGSITDRNGNKVGTWEVVES
jgi:hypothetical protein